MDGNQDDNSKLLDYVQESVDVEEDFHFLRFESLQRLNIVSLQVQLARMKSRLHQNKTASPAELDELRVLLSNYTNAIRDYQYLQNKTGLDKSEARSRKLRLHSYFWSASEMFDPWESHYAYFHDGDGGGVGGGGLGGQQQRQKHRQHNQPGAAASTTDPFRRLLMRVLPSRLTFSHQERQARAREYEEGRPPRHVSGIVDGLARFVMAIAGGVFLIVPMIVMTLQPSQTKSLVTVSVAVVVFSLLLSFGIKVSNVETLVSTATYAAVLVVFVGTSSGGGT